MAQEHKYIHMITELLAVIVIVPFLISLLTKYKFKPFDKFMIYVFIIATILIDGYLFFTWFEKKESFENNVKKDMIMKLIRQTSRWSHASRQDKDNLIAVLHANYGAGYLWALKDLFSDNEIEQALGSKELREQLEAKVIEIQDKATKNAVKDCPQYAGTIDFLSKLGGES